MSRHRSERQWRMRRVISLFTRSSGLVPCSLARKNAYDVLARPHLRPRSRRILALGDHLGKVDRSAWGSNPWRPVARSGSSCSPSLSSASTASDHEEARQPPRPLAALDRCACGLLHRRPGFHTISLCFRCHKGSAAPIGVASVGSMFERNVANARPVGAGRSPTSGLACRGTMHTSRLVEALLEIYR